MEFSVAAATVKKFSGWYDEDVRVFANIVNHAINTTDLTDVSGKVSFLRLSLTNGAAEFFD